jgi:hypothetical protein
LGIAGWPAFRSLTVGIRGMGVRQPAAEKKIKIQKANGKGQMESHLKFALCYLNFEFVFRPRLPDPS